MARTTQETGLPEDAEGEGVLAFARGLARETRALILKAGAQGFGVERKDDHSLVTDADRAAERLLREAIGARYPDHGVIGEEFGASRADAAWQWVLDPIDGTENFARGIPTYGTMIALRHAGTPWVAVIDHPALDLCFWALRGAGAFCNGERIRLPRETDLEPARAIVCTTAPANYQRFNEGFQLARLFHAYPNLRIYRDCFAHTLVVHGKADAMAEFNVKLWDIAASELLVSEAGGRFALLTTRCVGDERFYSAVFGQPALVDRLLTLFTAPAP